MPRGFLAEQGKLFILAVILAGSYGISDEIHQGFVPGRNSDALDVLADITGALAGTRIYIIYFKKIHRTVKTEVTFVILRDMTMADFSRELQETQIIAVPYGTLEEHGKHLPLSTDTLVVQKVLDTVSKRKKIFIAPPINYGVCTSTGQHPGTISISPGTIRHLTYDIVQNAYEKGLRKFLLVSGHAGSIHISAIKEAGESLSGRLKGAVIAALSIYDLVGKEISEIAETRNDSHAGEMETSLMLHINDNLVKGRSKEEYPTLPWPMLVADKTRYWPGGVWGNPEAASAEKGEKLFDIMVTKTIELINKMEHPF